MKVEALETERVGSLPMHLHSNSMTKSQQSAPVVATSNKMFGNLQPNDTNMTSRRDREHSYEPETITKENESLEDVTYQYKESSYYSGIAPAKPAQDDANISEL